MNLKIFFAVILCVVLGFGYYYIPEATNKFPLMLGLQLFQFMAMALMCYTLRGRAPALIAIATLIAGIALRITIIPTDPLFENDFWRYMWDGRVLAHGINPYLFIPEDPKLDHLDIYYRTLIGWRQYTTIYPPAAQLLFAASHLVFPDSLVGLKSILVSFDVATFFLIFFWMKQSTPAKLHWVCFYFLNPLVLKEIANSSHLDSIPTFFCVAALYFIFQKRHLMAPAVLAIATCAKLYPAVFLPLMLKTSPKRWTAFTIYLATVAALYGPFLLSGWSIFGGTQAFASYWEFNSCFFGILDYAHDFLGFKLQLDHTTFVKRDYAVKILVGLAISFWIFRCTRNPTLDLPESARSILGAVLLLSPVIDPWYVVWILPFAVLTRSIPWIVFSFLVNLSYSWFEFKAYFEHFKALEYSLFFLVAFLTRAKRWRQV